MPLSIFGFQALWSPYFILVILFFTVLYFLITVKWRKDFKVNEPLKKGEATYFLLAMVLLYAIKGSPVDLIAHILFTVHMVQMALLLLLFPIFLIRGIPWWVWKVVIEAPVIKPVFQFVTRPIFALIFFVAMFSMYHIPLVFDFIKLDETLHGMFTFVLFLSALFMYWPLLNEMEGQHQLKDLKKIGYIFANAVLITPACALIIFSGFPMYATYTDGETWLKAMELCVPASTLEGLTLSGPELFNDMDPVHDQQLGGVIMKILQEIIFAVLLGKIFSRWYRAEQKNADEITRQALLDRQALIK